MNGLTLLSSRQRRRGWAVLSVLGVLAGTPRAAYAHTHLTKSDPAANARLTVLPMMLRLWYSEAPELAMTRVALTDSSGKAVALGGVERDDNKLAVHFRIVGHLSAGLYKVSWKTAASDGHPSQGTFAFRILTEAVKSIAPPASMVDSTDQSASEPSAETIPYIVARALAFASILSVVGVVAFLGGVVSRAHLDEVVHHHILSRIAKLGMIGAATVLLSAIIRLPLQASMMAGGDPLAPMMMTVLLRTQWGWMLAAQAIASVVAIGGFSATQSGRRGGLAVAALGAVVIAATPALSGHAAASQNFAGLAIATDAIHVIAASAWLGNLLCVVVAAAGLTASSFARDVSFAAVRSLVLAFSPLALTSAAVVVVTGVVSAWLRLGSLPALWTSDYGRILLLKLATLGGVVVTGAYNWLRVRPALGSEAATRRLVRSATVELVVGLGVIVITAVLVAAPTSSDVAMR